MNKEIIERLNEIKRVVNSNTLEELIEAYPDAAGFSLCKESTYPSIVGISSFLVNNLIKDIERLNARGFYTIVLIIILVGFIAAGASGIILDFIVGIIKNI